MKPSTEVRARRRGRGADAEAHRRPGIARRRAGSAYQCGSATRIGSLAGLAHVARTRTRADPRHRSGIAMTDGLSASSSIAGSRLTYVTCGCIRSGEGELPARLRVIPDRSRGGDLAASAVRGRRRESVRQRQSAVDAAPGPGARRRDFAAGTGRAAGRRVHRVAGEAGGRRSRQGGEGTRSRTWCADCSIFPASRRPTPPTRSPAPSRTRTAGQGFGGLAKAGASRRRGRLV